MGDGQTPLETGTAKWNKEYPQDKDNKKLTPLDIKERQAAFRRCKFTDEEMKAMLKFFKQ